MGQRNIPSHSGSCQLSLFPRLLSWWDLRNMNWFSRSISCFPWCFLVEKSLLKAVLLFNVTDIYYSVEPMKMNYIYKNVCLIEHEVGEVLHNVTNTVHEIYQEIYWTRAVLRFVYHYIFSMFMSSQSGVLDNSSNLERLTKTTLIADIFISGES